MKRKTKIKKREREAKQENRAAIPQWHHSWLTYFHVWEGEFVCLQLSPGWELLLAGEAFGEVVHQLVGGRKTSECTTEPTLINSCLSKYTLLLLLLLQL